MFCFHYWRRRDPPGALSIALLFREMENDHVVFVSSEICSLVFVEPISFDTLLRRKYFDTLLRRKHLKQKCCLGSKSKNFEVLFQGRLEIASKSLKQK